jgi:hypothetical protein
MAPGEAARDFADGYRPTPIDEAQGWQPALRSAAQDSQYTGWVPARVCQVYFEDLEYAGRHFTHGPKHKPIAIGFWEVAATPAGRSGATGSARSFGVNSGDLRQRMQETFAPIEELDLVTDTVKESRDQRYQTNVGKTLLTFDGHAKPDSTMTPGEQHFQLAADGDRRIHWTIELSFVPDSVTALLGGLSFRGKGDLGQALRASPIRLVGPLFSGGRGVITFTR